MKAGGMVIGILFLISGWLLVLAALVLLSNLPARLGFALAAVLLQLLGLGLFAFAGRASGHARPGFTVRSSR